MNRASAKHSLRRILFIVIATVLLIAAPFSIVENMKTKRVYLFSEEFWMDLVTRFQGAGRLRFVLQPITGLLLGVAHGRKDVHKKSVAYQFESSFRNHTRLEIWRHVFHVLSVPIMIGILADVIYQIVLFRNVHVVPALIIGPLFISGPYILARSITNTFHFSKGGKK